MADSSLQDASGGVGLLRPPRSEGLHASTLLRRMHPFDSTMDPAQLAVYGLLGLAFEDRAELALLSLSKEKDWPWTAFRPGEVSHDGVACSPDILLVPKVDGPLRELSLKCKWKSCRGLPIHEEGENEFPLDKFGYDLDQCMGYGTPLDTLGGLLLVYFVNGDYSGARLPKVHGWELEWSEQERSETWESMLGVR